MKKAIACGLLLLTLIGNALWAAVAPPQQVVQETSTRMLSALRQNYAALKQNSSQIYGLVDQIVLPNFDFELMSRWVLGRAWQQATPDQRNRFTQEFRTLLVRTYAKALLEYANDDVRMSPQSGAVDGNEATVKTEVRVKSGQPIQINYSMHLANDAWKVYDVTVDGVSLVTSYRGTFATQIRDKGMDAVIADLQQRNHGAGNAR
ncbi:MAG TPA: ABC transporter substrate-binding protein [Candidatus Competibacteraceae bacterium]|nr:ABC transporter substrate-binding protein [Candidatus Competibacteraceae bacterium]HQA24662.1 ABC transporter substrate-binding protein [Candidatus Competibacteraceae bacterium]HQD54911.1 ABC transporter substrate-binding protein [Candidatus Competibacteraceae bacterium]